jgi:hypothetical protein
MAGPDEASQKKTEKVKEKKEIRAREMEKGKTLAKMEKERALEKIQRGKVRAKVQAKVHARFSTKGKDAGTARRVSTNMGFWRVAVSHADVKITTVGTVPWRR